MIDAVALGPADAVFSVSRQQGKSDIVANTRNGAVSLYQTPDKLEGLWVSPAGNVHAVGKRYHTNAGGAWRASKLPAPGFVLWGVSDAALFAGGLDGAIMQATDGVWSEIGNVGALVMGVHGTSAANVQFVGSFAGVGVFDGKTFTRNKQPGPGYWQAVFCAAPDKRWFCGMDQLLLVEGTKARPLGTVKNGELYGVGIGRGGVFVHAGYQLLKQTGDTFEVVNDNADKCLMIQNATYATCMTSNGTRVVAGGSRSVLVEDGSGFVEWPGLGIAPKAKPAQVAKPKAAKQPKPAAKPAKKR